MSTKDGKSQSPSAPSLSEKIATLLSSFNGIEQAKELAIAREIATAAVLKYGDETPSCLEKIRTQGIWNDHASVQAALVAIRWFLEFPQADGLERRVVLGINIDNADEYPWKFVSALRDYLQQRAEISLAEFKAELDAWVLGHKKTLAKGKFEEARNDCLKFELDLLIKQKEIKS